jgi:hypothetical protein
MGCPQTCFSLDQNDPLSQGTLGRRQRNNAAIECNKPTLVMNGQAQQVGIRDLAVPLELTLEGTESLGKTDEIRPEEMSWMSQIRLKEGE